MKKIISLNIALVLLALCGCTADKENKDTRFLFDTLVTLSADCSDEILDGAFSLCEHYEQMLSRTVATSDVSKISGANDFVKVNKDTAHIIDRACYYSALSNGDFDVTVCEVSALWDFNGTAIPDRKEIAEALKNVDYQSIQIKGNTVNPQGKKIDLGGIAKGYIADKLLDYFKDNGVKSGTINLGGNIVTFGEKAVIGIAKPFSENETVAVIEVEDKSIVTSGIYQRYIEKDGKIYHHILDTKTGFSADTDLASATVIGDTSLDCDALATICILKGEDEAKKLINATDGFEAIFISRTGEITYTSGLYREGDKFYLS